MAADSFTEIVADEILRTTEDAILCMFEDVGEIWIPKSQIDNYAPGNWTVGDKNVVMEIATWLVRKHHLDD